MKRRPSPTSAASATALEDGIPQPNKQRRIVMVGHGMVSHRFCVEWARRQTAPSDELIIIGEEAMPAYDRIHLTNGLTGGMDRSLELAPREWYADHGIALHLGDAVTRIDRERKQVRRASGAALDYDVLILATGSAARRLPIPGADLPGTFVYRNLADLGAIRDQAGRVSSAAVLGGGLLGLEAARALLDLGLQTHVIEAASGLMSRQLHPEAAELLEQRVRASGIRVVTSCITEKIFQDDQGLHLEFRDGRTLRTGMVVMAAGVVPRDQLAVECGLKTGARGGILVDASLQTSDPHIFAIGECALPRGTFYGFAAPGFDMARVLATRLTGGRAEFSPVEYPVRLKLAGADVVTIGDIRGEGTLLTCRGRGSISQLLVSRGRLTGVSLLGNTEDAGRLHSAVLKRQRLSSRAQQRFLATGSPWKASHDDVRQWAPDIAICQCTGVTRGQLTCAMAAGCETVAALTAETGAGSVCGSCRPLLARLTGATSTPAVRFVRVLIASCVAVTLVALAHLLFNPIPLATSIRGRGIDNLWLDGTLKQITGYLLLGLMLLGLALPLRKRLHALAKVGDYAFWRVLHTGLGAVALLALVSHTGFRLGFQLNQVLMLNVLALALTGALSGGVTALTHRLPPRGARLLQTGWTCVHAFLCWPLLVLIVFHILTVYRY